MARGPLITLQEFKTAAKIHGDEQDERIETFITQVSDLAHDYCAPHEFLPDPAATPRVFLVADGLTEDDWFYLPVAAMSAPPATVEALASDDTNLGPVSNFVTLPRNRRDDEPITALRFTTAPAGAEVQVTAKWGWPAPPPRVKGAIVEAVRDWLRWTQALNTQDRTSQGSGNSGFVDRQLPSKTRTTLKAIRGYRL